MLALRDLYASTGGDQWLRHDNWLEGEPCVNSWYGVTCCPKSHPHLSDDGTQCLMDPKQLAVGTMDTVSGTFPPSSPDTPASFSDGEDAARQLRLLGNGWEPPPHGRALAVEDAACHSGNYTGDIALDAATCEVVALDLEANNLIGRLPDSVFDRSSLTFLKVLKLKSNTISGVLPRNVSYATFSRLELSGNAFEYPPPPALLALCLSGRVKCRGYPPESCDAFGEEFKPSATKSTLCVECAEAWVSIMLVTFVLIIFMVLLVLYAYFMTRYQGITTQGVSTISIIMVHMQTVGILGKLRLAWPPSAKAAMDWIIIDGVNLDGAKPECIFQKGEGGTDVDLPMFFIVSITKICLPLIMLLAVGFVRSALYFLWKKGVLKRSLEKQQEAIDKLERVETLVYSLPLTGSWQGTFELVRAINTGIDETDKILARTGASVALTLFFLQIIYFVKYGFYTKMLLKLERMEKEEEEEGSAVTLDKPTREPSLVKRASSAIPTLVTRASSAIVPSVITRASSVVVDTYKSIGLGRMRVRTAFTCKRFAGHAPHWQFVIWTRQFALTWVTLIPGILAARGSADEVEYIRGNADTLMIVQVTVSCGILVIFTAWHWCVKPFAFAFQNWLEMWMLLSSSVIIALAGVYSAFGGPEAGIVIEVFLTSVLVGSVGLAGGYLVIHYRKFLKEQAAKAARRVSRLSVEGRRRMSSVVAGDGARAGGRRSSTRSSMHNPGATQVSVDTVSVSANSDLGAGNHSSVRVLKDFDAQSAMTPTQKLDSAAQKPAEHVETAKADAASEGREGEAEHEDRLADESSPWMSAHTEEGHQYWYNTLTNESSWTPPNKHELQQESGVSLSHEEFV